MIGSLGGAPEEEEEVEILETPGHLVQRLDTRYGPRRTLTNTGTITYLPDDLPVPLSVLLSDVGVPVNRLISGRLLEEDQSDFPHSYWTLEVVLNLGSDEGRGILDAMWSQYFEDPADIVGFD